MANWNTLLPESLAVDGQIDDELLKKIPAKRGVALLAAGDQTPILLLPAADLRSRIANRFREPTEEERTRMPDLAEVTRSIRWMLTTSHFETDLCYFELVRQIWPKRIAELVAFKPPWFVQVDPSEQRPFFRRGRDVLAKPGTCVGPFQSAKSAERFIGIIEDVCRLCREVRCLAQAPHAAVCTYGQMDKCTRPCDGTISLEAYREQVAQAAELAVGNDQSIRGKLSCQMQQAAKELAFERAGAIKAQLERLDELDDPEFRQVRLREQLAYLTVQRSSHRHKVKLFLVGSGQVASAGELRFPLVADGLEPVLAQLGEMARKPGTWSLPDRYRMGLVAQMAQSSRQRGGLWFAWSETLGWQDVANATERHADTLKVTPAPVRKKKQPSKSAPRADTKKGSGDGKSQE